MALVDVAPRTVPGLLGVALLIAGCGSEPSGAEGSNDTESAVIGCEGDTRAVAYAANLEQEGDAGLVTFVLVRAEPAPPARGDNDWIVELLNADGEPISDAELTASPFMPEHGHGSTDVTAPNGSDGEYEIAPVDFFMPGLWRVTLDAETDGGSDSTDYFFCIEG